MKRFRAVFLILPWAFAMGGLSVGADEEERKVRENEIYQQFFPLPPEFLSLEPAGADPFVRGGLRPKGRPVLEIFEDLGIVFGEGETVFFGGATSGMIVSATAKNMKKVERLLDEIYKRESAVVRIQLEVYAVPQKNAARFSVPAGGKPVKAVRVIEGVRRLAAEGNAELLFAPALSTREMGAGEVESGRRIDIISGYEDKEGRDVPVRRRVLEGFRLEVESLINADRKSVDMQLKTEFSRGKATIKRRVIPGPATGNPREIESVDLRRHELSGKFTVCGGEPQLIGNFPSGDADGEDTVLVFLTAEVVVLLEDAGEKGKAEQ